MTDALFTHVERVQGTAPWGRVLDAGTGRDSLRWISGLTTERWTAVTADDARARRLEREFRRDSRPNDRVIAGNWTDPTLLAGEVFDVVLADYLVGAIDRFAPYFQYRFLERIRPHVGKRLYAIGLEPFGEPPTPGARLILDVAELRDACILHAGHRPHREYPLDWMLDNLPRADFYVEDVRVFPIVWGMKYVREQLDVCRGKLPVIADRALVRGLEHRIAKLEKTAKASYEVRQGVQFGSDWVISSRPADR